MPIPTLIFFFYLYKKDESVSRCLYFLHKWRSSSLSVRKEKQRDRQTGRQIDRKRQRETERKTGRVRERERESGRESEREKVRERETAI